jgi:hypothetical protein
MTTLPDSLYQHIFTLGYFAVAVNTEQVNASWNLRETFRRGDIHQLPDALRKLSRAYTRNVSGIVIPASHNWIKRTASHLADAIDAWLSDQLERAA